MSVPLLGPEIDLLHAINLGLFSNLLKNWSAIRLMDTPVSYKASMFALFTLTLYKMALSKLT